MAAPRILVTRSPHQASPLADALRTLGLEPILIPTIELAPPTTFAPLDEAITSLDTFHWLLFTSANAVEAFASRLSVLEGTGFSPSNIQLRTNGALAPVFGSHLFPLSSTPCLVAAIGPATARALQPLGIKPDLIPEKAIAESLAEVLLPHALQPDGTPTRFLLVRAESARDHLPDTLRAAGAHVTIAPAYRTITPTHSVDAIQHLFSTREIYPDAITFTSSSTATNLLALLEASGLVLPPEIPRISIGPITSTTLRDLNLPPQAEAQTPDVQALALAVLEVL